MSGVGSGTISPGRNITKDPAPAMNIFLFSYLNAMLSQSKFQHIFQFLFQRDENSYIY